MAYELTTEQQKELCRITNREGYVFHDVREDVFAIYGLYEPRSGGCFLRMPEETAEKVSDAVKRLNYNTAGGRVRFTTDAESIIFYCKTKNKKPSLIMNRVMSLGFDVYMDCSQVGGRTPQSFFVNSVQPPYDFEGGYAYKFNLPGGEHALTVNFPLYHGVDELYLGFPEGATLKAGLPYVNEKPIVYYGSSITQGAAASRPGLAYPAIISRRLNADYINLGFAGSAKAEEAMIDYLASLDMCCFVQDYDHNAPNVEHLRNTHYKLYKRMRDSHPDLPILLLSRPGFNSYQPTGYLRTEDSTNRRDVVIDTFRAARAEGDELVWYIDGESFFSGPDETECTVDGIHPTDLGMMKMADNVHRVLLRMLNDVPFLKRQ